MEKIIVNFFRVILAFLVFVLSECRSPGHPDEYYCSVIAGEPTQTSVILSARLQRSDTLVNEDLQGISGFIKFRITRNTVGRQYMESPFFRAYEKNDFGTKYEFTGLRPGQKYFYSISYGKDTANNTSSSWSDFTTLNLPVSEKNISFVISSKINYKIVYENCHINNASGIPELALKHSVPVFSSISSFQPDFWITNWESESDSNHQLIKEMPDNEICTQWHNLYCIADFNQLISHIPLFWIFSDSVGYKSLIPEQLPLKSMYEKNYLPFRTYQLNRDIQIWLTGSILSMVKEPEGRNIESQNLKLLKTSLKESNSPFRIIVTAEPVIGCGLNPGMKTESGELKPDAADSLFNWLKGNGFRNNGLYFLCNGTDIMYHSVNYLGFEEFSCGSLFDSPAGAGIASRDSISINQAEMNVKSYFFNDTEGGFLLIGSGRDEYNSPVLFLRFFNGERKLIYAVNKF